MFSKNNSQVQVGGLDHVPQGRGPQPRQHLLQATRPPLQTLLLTPVTNPSTSSKPPLKLAAVVPVEAQLVLLAKHRLLPRVFYEKVLVRELALEPVLEQAH